MKIDDFAKAQVIFLIGHNPGTNHPRMLTTLAEAKQAGATIIAINPLVEAGLLRFKDPQGVQGRRRQRSKADGYLSPNSHRAGDIPLFKGIMKEMMVLEGCESRQSLQLGFYQCQDGRY